jgi:hypothetical protein
MKQSVFVDCCESIFDEECLPAVKPQIQILVRGPADAAVLRTIHLLAIDVSRCIADDSIQQPCCLDRPDAEGFGENRDHLRPGVVARARIHLVDGHEALVGLA